MMRSGKIILIDDHEAVLKALRVVLSREFKTVLCVATPTLLPALLRDEDVDVVLLDMNFGVGKQTGREGLFWLDRMQEQANPPAVVLITAFGDIELAVSCLKKGAADFIVKPWDNDKLVETVTTAFERRLERNRQASRTESDFLPEENRPLIEQLVQSLLKKYASAYGKQLPRLTPEALQKLSDMTHRGDWAALQETIERAILLTNETLLDATDFLIGEAPAPLSRPLTLDEMEKQFIREVLQEKKGNLTLCAQQLDISRQTLYNKMKKYGL